MRPLLTLEELIKIIENLEDIDLCYTNLINRWGPNKEKARPRYFTVLTKFSRGMDPNEDFEGEGDTMYQALAEAYNEYCKYKQLMFKKSQEAKEAEGKGVPD